MKRAHLALALLMVVAQASFAEGEQQPSSETSATPIEHRSDFLLQASPKGVLRLREKIQDFSAAKNVPIPHDFEPDVPQETLDLEDVFDLTLEPSAPAPTLFISRFQSSAVSFVDAYGNPWPIRKISSFLGEKIIIDRAVPDTAKKNGGKKGEEDSSGIDLKDPQAGSFTLTAVEHGVVGNLTVFLYGNPTPISILLVGKPAMYHRIATMRVGDVGPQTDSAQLFQDTGVTIGTETDMDLNHALYGVTPQGSEEMVVEGGEGKAWLKDQTLFLRTPLSVFSPQILRTSPGNGRYRAYKLVAATTVMATNNEGRTVKLKIMRHPATDIYDQNNFK